MEFADRAAAHSDATVSFVGHSVTDHRGSKSEKASECSQFAWVSGFRRKARNIWTIGRVTLANDKVPVRHAPRQIELEGFQRARFRTAPRPSRGEGRAEHGPLAGGRATPAG